MMYSLRICQHLTFRSNINIHESEGETQNSVSPPFLKNNAIAKKNLIEKLYECKLSLLGANGWYILECERWRIKLIST